MRFTSSDGRAWPEWIIAGWDGQSVRASDRAAFEADEIWRAIKREGCTVTDHLRGWAFDVDESGDMRRRRA